MDVKTVVSLSDREEQWVLNLARGMKPCPAAVAAGFSAPMAASLLSRPHLASAIRSITANMVAVARRLDSAA